MPGCRRQPTSWWLNSSMTAARYNQPLSVWMQMPLSNATQMTDAERAMLARWIEGQNKR